MSAALLDLLTQHAGRHVLIVTHAGVIRAAMAHVYIRTSGATPWSCARRNQPVARLGWPTLGCGGGGWVGCVCVWGEGGGVLLALLV